MLNNFSLSWNIITFANSKIFVISIKFDVSSNLKLKVCRSWLAFFNFQNMVPSLKVNFPSYPNGSKRKFDLYSGQIGRGVFHNSWRSKKWSEIDLYRMLKRRFFKYGWSNHFMKFGGNFILYYLHPSFTYFCENLKIWQGVKLSTCYVIGRICTCHVIGLNCDVSYKISEFSDETLYFVNNWRSLHLRRLN